MSQISKSFSVHVHIFCCLGIRNLREGVYQKKLLSEKFIITGTGHGTEVFLAGIKLQDWCCSLLVHLAVRWALFP